ncbi:outer membrane beta-barrel protein [Roseibium aggregatum]|uniref:Outer membrane beta-barrel protein n=1 Tax=Roseibium aggregatum TaxID=187304 RepID=A0A939EFQ0_9HYPH|nr:outer membrane beta-barrel protein [Roseibium aggregatum]MBN9672392.1 outer membrane beta-barrel protein [Roseibium aggregatum]
MRPYLYVLVCCTALQAVSAAAQSALPDLRGSADAEDALAAEETADAAAQNTQVNPTRSNVFALRPTLNAAEAEADSSGLGTNGPVLPIRPFSDRIAAVGRSVAVNGEVIDTSVFGGDTSFDAPQGIRLGSFTLTPQLTLSAGYTDNTAGSAAGEGGSLVSISPDVALTSNWSRHQFDASLRGTYVSYPENSDDNDGTVTAAANLRLDVSEATQIDGGVAFTYAREEDGSAESASGVDNIQTLSGSLGASRQVGIVAATAAFDVDRSTYSSDDGSDSVFESARDNTLFSTSLRLDGNTGSVFSPFVEGSLLLRRYDETCSGALCENRNANGYQLRGGLTVASAPKVSAEIGGGWRIENIEDDRLDDLSGLVVSGSLVWSPSRLTTVTGGIGTSFDSTDIPTASGSIVYSGDLRLAHEFSDRLVAETGVGYSYRTYEGISIEEQTLTGFGGVTFALTKNTALTANYTHRRFESSQQGSDYTENAVEAGLRFRH